MSVRHSVRRQYTGYCPRICCESSTLHLHMPLLKKTTRGTLQGSALQHAPECVWDVRDSCQSLFENGCLFSRVLHLLLSRCCYPSAKLDTDNFQHLLPFPCCWAAENAVLSSLPQQLPAASMFCSQHELQEKDLYLVSAEAQPPVSHSLLQPGTPC